MNVFDIKNHNLFQPNHYFSVRGEIKYIEKEVKFTKIVLSVFNYQNPDGKTEEFPVYFRGKVKEIVDAMATNNLMMSVLGDIVPKGDNFFLDGKMIEIMKKAEIVREGNSKFVNPNDANYDRAF